MLFKNGQPSAGNRAREQTGKHRNSRSSSGGNGGPGWTLYPTRFRAAGVVNKERFSVQANGTSYIVKGQAKQGCGIGSAGIGHLLE